MSDATRSRLATRERYERPHILVVTDDPDLSAFLKEGLPLGGFWITVIASGIQALEVFRLRQFDLVLVDLELGSFRSLELLRRLRGQSDRAAGEAPRTSAPLVTIATHESLDATDREALAIEDTMMAPLDIEDIVQRLHQVFAAWRQANPDVPLADASAAARAR